MSYTNGINNLQPSLAIQTLATPKTALDQSASASVSDGVDVGNAGKDQASLSPTSALLSQALTTSDVRADKVASLQQAIAAGSYNVSSSDVADKLLQTLQS